jgi:hypothetical protein
MNCKDLKELLSAYVDGELSRTQREFLEEHLAGCADCRAILKGYRAVNQKLASLREVPAMLDRKSAIMSKIKGVSNQPVRHWLHPALVAIPIVAILIALSVLQPWSSFPGTQSVFAKAVVTMEAIKSYRAISTPGIYIVGWDNTHNSKFEEFTLPDRAHLKFVINGVTSEYIFIGENLYYSTNNTLTFLLPYMPGYPQSTEDARQNLMYVTLDKLRQSSDLRQLPDEVFDGVNCLHYKGNERSNPYTIELWIGKDDYLVRQVIEQKIPQSGTQINGSDNAVTRFYDFNVPITIEAPVTESGDLLPGWKVVDMRQLTSLESGEPVQKTDTTGVTTTLRAP